MTKSLGLLVDKAVLLGLAEGFVTILRGLIMPKLHRLGDIISDDSKLTNPGVVVLTLRILRVLFLLIDIFLDELFIVGFLEILILLLDLLVVCDIATHNLLLLVIILEFLLQVRIFVHAGVYRLLVHLLLGFKHLLPHCRGSSLVVHFNPLDLKDTILDAFIAESDLFNLAQLLLLKLSQRLTVDNVLE